ncbi:MAG: DUF1800 domain-containing protein [Gemmatimonadales bacterium]|nr:DUF1800 domain-containing protein [Gemmatimonadales bacterium]
MHRFLACLLLPGALHAQAPAARDSAWHALNRLAFGPTPGLVDSVARTGVRRWVEQQLAERADDRMLRDRERGIEVLRRSPESMARLFVEARREVQAMRRERGDTAAAALEDPVARRDMLRDLPEEARELRERIVETQRLAILRPRYAGNQLREVLADFWLNHFNVFAGKGPVRALIPAYTERTIRPHVLGRFRDLLLATARAPAMLVYLDNAQSIAPGSEPGGLIARRVWRSERMAERRSSGINENYARELLELHTLGVDGGYTQADVQAVARILTGWSIEPPQRGGQFVYRDWAHDRGEKVVLGERFPAGRGEDEGERLLDLLAMHPATMKHVGAKLCARLVADDPPDGCIDDAVAAWRRTNGDLRAVVTAIVLGDDFWAPQHRGAKFKSPLEYTVSALRAVGAEPDTSARLALVVARLGQPLYQHTAPDGYPERSDDWVNSGMLLQRMNVGVGLAAGKLPGATFALPATLPPAGDLRALVAQVDTLVLGGRMTARTRDVILQEIATLPAGAPIASYALGLAIGGPEFQRQ